MSRSEAQRTLDELKEAEETARVYCEKIFEAYLWEYPQGESDMPPTIDDVRLSVEAAKVVRKRYYDFENEIQERRSKAMKKLSAEDVEWLKL